MAKCYICGNENATYKRSVPTGNSFRTTYSMKGNAYFSSSVHFGVRNVCARCALNIDYEAKKRPSIAALVILIIIFGGILAFCIPALSKINDMSVWLSFAVIMVVSALISGLVLKQKAKKKAEDWYYKNADKYID